MIKIINSYFKWKMIKDTNYYIIKFINNNEYFWLSELENGTGRTITEQNAKRYNSENSAKITMNRMSRLYPELEGKGIVQWR